MAPGIEVSRERIAEFCRKWRITEFSLFGSVLRADFRPESDVDALVVFEEGMVWDFDHYDAMEAELRAMFGRRVDLVQQRNLLNPYRRSHILANRRVMYAAA